MKVLADCKPGDMVLVYSVNSRSAEPREAKVAKVGRTTIHIANDYGSTNPYDLHPREGFGGAIKDRFGHSSVFTHEMWAARERSIAVQVELRSLGVTFDHRAGRYGLAALEVILAAVKSVAPEATDG